ncbi:InlB B-repeat-containing protein [Cohnella fermenti]|uniref:Bacterial repeat domain-containing protein n=1 Tax=Cohnella fermenti TaxID=2565925 RepID=A0A4S4BE84_9BACL|nr:hypothetical protein E6C55_33510 [Cohnella fermenti]
MVTVTFPFVGAVGSAVSVAADGAGGSFSGSEVTVEHGQTIAEPTEPTRVGYAFEGWYVDPADETGEWDFDAAPVVEDMTLYAHWTLNSSDLTSHVNVTRRFILQKARHHP